MKKLISITLLLALTYNLAGYFAAFKIMLLHTRQAVKEEIKKNIPEAELTLITVAAGDMKTIKWINPKKEFKHQGKLYDVVRTETGNNSTHYYCIEDTQEARLFANLDEHVKNHINQGNTSSGHSKNILKLLLPDSFTEKYFPFFDLSGSAVRMDFYSVIFSSPFPEITAPPPKQG